MLDTEAGADLPNCNGSLSPPISKELSKKILYSCILQLQQNANRLRFHSSANAVKSLSKRKMHVVIDFSGFYSFKKHLTET